MHIKVYCLFLLFCFLHFSFFLSGQDATMKDWDELEKQLKDSEKPEELIRDIQEQASASKSSEETYKAYSILMLYFQERSQYDSALHYAISLQKALQKYEVDSLTWAKLYQKKGVLFGWKNRIDSSYHYLKKSSHLYESLDYLDGLAEVLHSLGFQYYKQSDYEKALEHYYASLNLKDSISYTGGKSITLTNLGIIHQELKDYKKARDYYWLAFQEENQKEDHFGIASNLGNLGIIYKQLGQYDSALWAYKRSNFHYSKIQNEIRMQYNLVNVGELHRTLGNLDSSMQYQEQAYRYFDAQKNEGLKARLAVNLGRSALSLGQISKSLTFAREAKKYAEEHKNLFLARDAYGLLAEIYARQGAYREAYNYHKQFTALKDSVLNEEKLKSIQQLEAQYENEKKSREMAEMQQKELEQDNKILIQEQQLAREARIKWLLLSASLMMLLFFYLIFRWKKEKIRSQLLLAEKENELHKQKLQELDRKKSMAAMDDIIKAQDLERKRIANDLHDSLGSILASLPLAETSDGRSTVLAGKAHQEFRRIIYDLMPPSLEASLEDALQDLAEKLSRGSSTSIQIEQLGRPYPIPIDKRTQLYFILQELIQNCIKHASASYFMIQLLYQEEGLEIYAEDDGRGLKDPKASGMGLKNLSSRIQYLKGSIKHYANEPSGLCWEISVPLKKKEESLAG